ncbi:RDD family protein [Candidatus Bathyarchaeota archaeon]|nr:RDD family protein [Candidatus Bathyarchaeota archaeon]
MVNMVRCPGCGEWNPYDSAFCRRCGGRLDASRRDTRFDRLTHDVGAQTLWVTRAIAYGVDAFIVGAVGAVLAALAYLPLWIGSLFGDAAGWRGVWGLPFVFGLGQVIYFTAMEYLYGATVGKRFLGLRVEGVNGGKPSLTGAFMRNASKIHVVALLLDVVTGLLLTDDPRDKFTDGVSGTYVVRGKGGVVFPGVMFQRPTRRSFDDTFAEFGDWGERSDLLEGAGFGVFLIVVATIVLNYPGTHLVVLDWVRSWMASGITPIPEALLAPLYWFFTAMGTWGVLTAVIRYYTGWNRWRAAQDILGGLFNFYLAYIIQRHGIGAFTWSILFPAFLVFVGGQVIVSVFLFPKKKRR